MRFKEYKNGGQATGDKKTYAYNYLINKGVPAIQAAGIIGNLAAESGLNTTVVGKADNKQSQGIGQWHSERLTGLKKFAGENWTNLDNQLDYILHELNTTEKRAKNSLFSAKTPQEATIAFMNDYERPAEWAKKQSSKKRVNEALQLSGLKPDTNYTYNSGDEPTQPNEPYQFREIKSTDYYAPQVSQNVSSLDNTQETTNLAEDKSAEIKNRLDQKKAEKAFIEQMIKATQVAYVNPADYQSKPTFEEPQQEQMFQQGGKFKEFYESYIKSPNYTKRLNIQGYKNIEQVKKDRLKNLNLIKQSEVNDIGSQYYHPLKNINIDPAELKKYNLNKETTTAHEYSHGIGAMNTGNSNFLKSLTLNSNETMAINDKNRYLDIDISNKNKKLTEAEKADIQHNSFPSEAKADIDALRYRLKKDNIYNTGTQEFNQSHLNKAKKLYSNDKMIKRNFKAFEDKDLINVMNTVAEQNLPPDDYIQYAQQGGIIEDDRGQWAYPGEITKINSGDITMEGVDYPVYGIDNLGNSQMMYPNQNYKFPGTSVTEYPQTKARVKTKRFSK